MARPLGKQALYPVPLGNRLPLRRLGLYSGSCVEFLPAFCLRADMRCLRRFALRSSLASGCAPIFRQTHANSIAHLHFSSPHLRLWGSLLSISEALVVAALSCKDKIEHMEISACLWYSRSPDCPS